MNSEDNRMPMSTVLIISAAFAVVFLILFMWVGGFGFFGAFFLGLLVGIVVFVVLMVMFGAETASGTGAGSATTAVSSSSAKPASAAAGSASVAATATKPGAADATKPGSGAAKGAERPAPKPGADGASTAQAKPEAAKAKIPAANKAKPPAAKSKPKAAPKTAIAPAASVGGEDYDRDGVVEGTGEGSKPATLSAPRAGGADNLKEIKGVGPAMEKLLNSMGFYHFDQVASWTADEVAWVNANLGNFKGRVTRDNWIEQAKILAAGGETEFSKKVDKGGVY